MLLKCNHCENTLGKPVYTPLNSNRNSQVYICEICGLCQTKQNVNPKLGSGSLTSDAGYGNVRRAKGVRLDTQKINLRKILSNLPRNAKVLDVGSSRGQFLKWCEENFKNLKFYGIEPDERFAETNLGESTIVEVARLLDSKIVKETKFDFIFCNHTLEHFDDAKLNLELLRNIIREDGILWIDVPNLEGIKDPMGVEEFFLDKHTFHFEPNTLKNMLKTVGFQIVENYSDFLNLAISLRPATPQKSFKYSASHTFEDFVAYKNLLEHNRANMSKVARKIEAIPNVGIYGAGRILDALVRHGKFNHQEFEIADRYLWESAETIGINIQDPSFVNWASFDTVVILARSSQEQIKDWLRSKNVSNFVTLDQLW
jgi:2-polyprenyl-3-methyl-5-hydroxy-6-metoxy-1,4-benzoquinol methylase